MKNLVKTFAIAALSAMTFIANATHTNAAPAAATKSAGVATHEAKTFEVGIFQSVNTMKMNVLIEKSADKDLIVELRDKNGDVLASERISKNKKMYHGKFDMSNLEDGKYTFVFTKGDERIVKEVELLSKTDRQISL